MGNVDKVDRTLAINEMIYYVRRDAELRRRWREDFDGLARQFGLTEAEQEAVRASDVARLNEMGVHQYLISQILRLTFGTRAASNTHPAMDAFKKAYPEEFARAHSAMKSR